MLYIKNGRLYTTSFSFAIPEGLSIDTDSDNLYPDTIAFKTKDGFFDIEIGVGVPFNKQPPNIRIEEIMRADCFVSMTDPIEVNRDGMIGLGLYYRGSSWETEYYEEFLEYPKNEEGQYTFTLCFVHRVKSELERCGIDGFMNEPNIKQLIESIRYNPEECRKAMN